MDWESRIEEVCEQLEIDPEIYNTNDGAKEMVAKILGFPSFACFAALPEPSAILDGRGERLLEGHRMQQLSLIESCVELIHHHYLLSKDEISLEQEVNRFVKYIERNFDDEPATVGLIKLSSMLMMIHPQFDQIPSSLEKYMKQVRNFIEKIGE